MLPESLRLIACLKAAADPVRLRLLKLCGIGECSVSELTEVLAQSQPRVSQQLKLLCDAGLVERSRDGQRVYYRLASGGEDAATRRQLLKLLPRYEPQFEADAARLRALRGAGLDDSEDSSPADRALHRAILDLTVAESVGDLLDIGCGRGQLLKLLSSRANRAIGVDTDAGARDMARSELMLAGLENCSLRKADMYRLPFDDDAFDTVILDDVLAGARRPVAALKEASRLLRPNGRMLLLQRVAAADAGRIGQQLAEHCRAAALRLTAPRLVRGSEPHWLLAVARPSRSDAAAA